MRAAVLALTLALMPAHALAVKPADLGPAEGARFTRGDAEQPPAEAWWTQLGDAQLARTVERALTSNLDLERARAAVDQSRGAALQGLSGLSPTVTANARASIAPTDSLGFQFGGLPSDPTQPAPPKTYTQGSATLDASWQLDVFGRNTATWRASQRDVSAARADLDQAGSSTATVVANAYLDVVAARERAAIVAGQIRVNAELLEVLELRYARGDATSLDVLQQRQQLASTRAMLPPVRMAEETTAQRLAVLLGQTPTELPSTADTLPELPEQVAVGTPLDLVENRADLRAAAERLEATRDRRWSAYASLAPTLGVTAQTGWQFFDLTERSEQTFWNAGANLTVPLFGGGRTHGGIQQTRAAHQAQAAAFQGAVLTAMQEVEASLSREAAQREALVAQQAQLDAADAAFDAARTQYLQGVTLFLNVQTALSRKQQAELTLLQARRDLLSARIALHQALGGPWTRDLARDDAATTETP